MLDGKKVIIHIITDCGEDTSLDINDSQSISILEPYNYKVELEKCANVYINPEDSQQIISVSNKRLISISIIDKEIDWKVIDKNFEDRRRKENK